jgi:thiol:disulfide interchange protein DsbD
VAIGAWLATGLRGRSLGGLDAFLPPPAVANQAELTWRINDYAGAMAVARETKQPVFIDFTGYTCTNCRWMESTIFSRPEIRAALARFVRARLFTDGDGAVYEQQQQFQATRFHTVALPLYAIVAPDGTVIATFPGLTRDPAAFLAFLMKVPRA